MTEQQMLRGGLRLLGAYFLILGLLQIGTHSFSLAQSIRTYHAYDSALNPNGNAGYTISLQVQERSNIIAWAQTVAFDFVQIVVGLWLCRRKSKPQEWLAGKEEDKSA